MLGQEEALQPGCPMTAYGQNNPEFRSISYTGISNYARRRGHFSGVEALMLAILREGVSSYLGARGPIRTEAEVWICTKD